MVEDDTYGVNRNLLQWPSIRLNIYWSGLVEIESKEERPDDKQRLESTATFISRALGRRWKPRSSLRLRLEMLSITAIERVRIIYCRRVNLRRQQHTFGSQ